MSDSVGASLPGAAPSEAAITAFLDAHRRVMDTDYESSDLPRVAVRAGLRAAYAVDRGAALEAGPLPENIAALLDEAEQATHPLRSIHGWDNDALGKLVGALARALRKQIAPRDSGNAGGGRVGGEEPLECG